ncbi:hypothetical protein BC834DRAFT_847132 [Gloeopeniophorella convolvens]|nr:hypothetical protein BC834DRAFT_847132 [Gloeopeniophorella convolvens]
MDFSLMTCHAFEKRPAHWRKLCCTRGHPNVGEHRTRLHSTLRQLGNLCQELLYGLVFQHLQALWQQDFYLVSDISLLDGETFSGKVSSFSHVFVSKRRYGASTKSRGQSARYGYIGNRIPVQIDYLFSITQGTARHGCVCTNVALVRRFIRDEGLPDVPWNWWFV